MERTVELVWARFVEREDSFLGSKERKTACWKVRKGRQLLGKLREDSFLGS
jgi:hypothetical protein